MVKQYIIVSLLLFIAACKHSANDEDNSSSIIAKANVRFTTISKEKLASVRSFYGTTQFFKRDVISAPITGYIRSVEIALGDDVKSGQQLFAIQTKEAAGYASSKKINDTLFSGGLIKIDAPANYEASTLLHQTGDYVQEGDKLCDLVDLSSLVINLSLPFESTDDIKEGTACTVHFSNGISCNGRVEKVLPVADIQTQTQDYLIKINYDGKLPENLSVTVQFPVGSKLSESEVLSRKAVLSNETQTEFWVMKLINDSTAR